MFSRCLLNTIRLHIKSPMSKLIKLYPINAIQVSILEKPTFCEIEKPHKKQTAAPAADAGVHANSPPKPVATPLPPLNPKKGEKQWPDMIILIA